MTRLARGGSAGILAGALRRGQASIGLWRWIKALGM